MSQHTTGPEQHPSDEPAAPASDAVPAEHRELLAGGTPRKGKSDVQALTEWLEELRG